jgi:hypothetical protein
MPRLSLVIFLSLAAACARRVPPIVTAADAERVQMPLAELDQGRTLTIRKCGRCHDTPMPSDHRAADWPELIGEMAERSKLEGDERTTITRYLVAMTPR